MTRKWWCLFICIVAVVALVGGGLVAGCAKKTAPAKPAEEGARKEVKRIALLLPGSITDAGWNANAYKGLLKLKDAGYQVAYVENVPVPNMEETLQNYASQGFDLVIGHGFQFGDPALRVAPKFPETWFFIFAKEPPNSPKLDNLGFIDQKEFEGAYLCGMLAALMSKSGKIGFVGGMEIPSQLSNLAAYTTGARSVRPDIKILGVITGTFSDPAKGKEAALAQIENGADVVMHTADSTGVGAIDACKEKGVYVIGYGGDQNDLAPNLVLTSLVVNIPDAIYKQVDRIKEGKFAGVWRAGIADGIIDIAPYHALEAEIPQEVRDKIARARQDIISGKLVVPEIHERIDR